MRVSMILASVLLATSCAPSIHRVKVVFDSSLLIKCPDFVVWALDEDLADWAIKEEKRYADCQARQNTLVDRATDAMNH